MQVRRYLGIELHIDFFCSGADLESVTEPRNEQSNCCRLPGGQAGKVGNMSPGLNRQLSQIRWSLTKVGMVREHKVVFIDRTAG